MLKICFGLLREADNKGGAYRHLRQDGPGKYTRSMELMPLEESREILDRIYALIIDGQSLRQIRHLLKE